MLFDYHYCEIQKRKFNKEVSVDLISCEQSQNFQIIKMPKYEKFKVFKVSVHINFLLQDDNYLNFSLKQHPLAQRSVGEKFMPVAMTGFSAWGLAG